jgi:16S rRNA (cytosine1402-N4)-methyltransferase
MEWVHKPVMAREVLQLLAPRETGPSLLIDTTLGEGGHSELFLSRFPDLEIIGVDADPQMLDRAKTKLGGFGSRVQYRNSFFDTYFARYSEDRQPDRILLDLGVSSYHFGHARRGFSFREDEPLDMRLSPDSERSAAEVVNETPEEELADIIYNLGEERYSRRIARNIVRARSKSPIRTSSELAEIVRRSVPKSRERLHPATRTFQALRIAVNDELGRIERALPAAFEQLAPRGRIGVIAFHSLEDRIVKRYFKSISSKPTAGEPTHRVMAQSLTKKPLTPDEDEARDNPPSRSAKFRALEKLDEEKPA